MAWTKASHPHQGLRQESNINSPVRSAGYIVSRATRTLQGFNKKWFALATSYYSTPFGVGQVGLVCGPALRTGLLMFNPPAGGLLVV